VQGLGAGGGLGGPAHTDVNFGGKKTNLGAAPHDWGFAKKELVTRWVILGRIGFILGQKLALPKWL